MTSPHVRRILLHIFDDEEFLAGAEQAKFTAGDGFDGLRIFTQLTRLLAHVARTAPLFVACEPRRAPLALAGSRMLWAIGCNDVSRHDAVVSVHAGFTGTELSALWPERAGWRLHEQAAGLFSHCFVARREGAGAAS